MKTIVYSVVLFLISHSTHAQIITTVAGNGMYSYSGDGGAATSASFLSLNSIALDTGGNLYILDPNASVIRKVDKNTGIITTVVGDGIPGYNGDFRTAVTAELNYPNDIYIDSKNNMYIADGVNHRIRKIDLATGIIQTIAGTGGWGYSGDGGPATSAYMTDPYGMDMDTAGNIYFSDHYNHSIRKITPSGYISTVAGTGVLGFSGDGTAATSAKMAYPTGLACDKYGNVYFSDYNNYRIRKVSASGIITTIAGTGISTFGGDSVLATSSAMAPFFLVFDPSGNLIYSDAVNNRIRKISSTGIVNTIVGSGVSGYNGDTLTALTAELYGPAGIRFDKTGNLYFSDNGNFRIRKVVNCVNHIITSPSNDTASATGNASFGIVDVSSSTYQWQENSGSSFVNLSNGGKYSGVNTKTLIVSSLTLAMSNYKYRCLASNGICTDTSNAATLLVNNLGINNMRLNGINIYPNPAKNDITITVPYQIQNIKIINALGQVLIDNQSNTEKEILNIENLQTGIYFIRINGLYIQKFIKE